MTKKCQKKVKYGTIEFAEEDMKRINARFNKPEDKLNTVHYCEECRCYHLTKSRNLYANE